MLIDPFEVVEVDLVGLFEVPVLDEHLGLEPHQLQSLQFYQLFVPVRALVLHYLLHCSVDEVQCLGVVFFVLKSIVELLLLL